MIRSEEKLTQNHYRRGKIQAETTEHEWMWITTLQSQASPPKVVRGLGHDRWKQENNGWNDLTQNGSLKHGFLHACRHRPHRVIEDQQSPPLPRRLLKLPTPLPAVRLSSKITWFPTGLPVVVLILMLAFTLCAAFTQCHSKLVRRYHLPGIDVARQLRVSVLKLPPRIRAPDSPAPKAHTI